MGAVPAGGIASLTLDDTVVPREHQFDRFRDATAPIFDVRPVDSTSTAPPTTALDYLVDGLIVSRLRYDAIVMRRTARHLDVADDTVSVLLHARGGMRGLIGDSTDLSADGEHVVIFDLAYSFTCCCDATEVIWIMIPRSRLRAAAPSPYCQLPSLLAAWPDPCSEHHTAVE